MIKYLITDYSNKCKFIAPSTPTAFFSIAELMEIVAVGGGGVCNKLAIVLKVSIYYYYLLNDAIFVL